MRQKKCRLWSSVLCLWATLSDSAAEWCQRGLERNTVQMCIQDLLAETMVVVVQVLSVITVDLTASAIWGSCPRDSDSFYNSAAKLPLLKPYQLP